MVQYLRLRVLIELKVADKYDQKMTMLKKESTDTQQINSDHRVNIDLTEYKGKVNRAEKGRSK